MSPIVLPVSLLSSAYHNYTAIRLGFRHENVTFALAAITSFGIAYGAWKELRFGTPYESTISKEQKKTYQANTLKVIPAVAGGFVWLYSAANGRVSAPNMAGLTGVGLGIVSALFVRGYDA